MQLSKTKVYPIALVVSIAMFCALCFQPQFADADTAVSKGGGTSQGTNVDSAAASVTYRAHVQNLGWQGYVNEGKTAGTTGKKLRMEALTLKLKASGVTGSVQYRAHVQNSGWQAWKNVGETAGTTGKKLRMEAVQIKLTGNLAKTYDVYYRAHVEQYGWLGWAKNGEKAGTAKCGYRMEALQVKLVKKGGKAPGSTNNAYTETPKIPVLSGDAKLDAQIYKKAKQLGSLRACYNWVKSHKHTNWYGRGVARYKKGTTYWMKDEAARMMNGKPVDCYAYSATLVYMARALGYEARPVCGAIPRRDGTWPAHSWAEIKVKGKWYLFDPDLERTLGGRYNLYMRTYSNAPLTYRH